jgi:hypothetical protein
MTPGVKDGKLGGASETTPVGELDNRIETG